MKETLEKAGLVDFKVQLVFAQCTEIGQFLLIWLSLRYHGFDFGYVFVSDFDSDLCTVYQGCLFAGYGCRWIGQRSAPPQGTRRPPRA